MRNIRKEAYIIIKKVLRKNLFSDKLLQQKAKKLSEQDIKLLYSLVKGILKMKLNLDYIASKFTYPKKYANTSLKIKILLYLGLYQLIYIDSIPDYAAVNETVELANIVYSNKIGNFINAVLRAYLNQSRIEYPDNFIDYLSYKYSFPKKKKKKWVKLWGEKDTEKLCEFFNQVPSVYFRLNRMDTSPDKIKKYFKRRQIDCKFSLASENVFTCENSYQILDDIAFQEGYYSVQDPSSALVVELMNPQNGESILDLFAGPGGKTTYTSELMMNTGEIVAIDKFPQKIKQLKRAKERLKLDNIILETNDAFRYGPVAPIFDRVLIDVPCTGWGVMQKKAELRYQKNQNLKELLKLQKNALKKAASFVKTGGYLIYSTCTMNPQENEEQINYFLAHNKEFVLVDAAECIKEEFTENGYLKTIPFKHNIAGAFAAKMKKLD